MSSKTSEPTEIIIDAGAGVYHFCAPENFVRNITAVLAYSRGEQKRELNLVRGAIVTQGERENRQIVELETRDEFLRATLSLSRSVGESLFEISAKVELLAARDDVRIQSIDLFKANFADTFLADGGREHCRFWSNWHDIWFPNGSLPLDGPEDKFDIQKSRAYHFASVYSASHEAALTFAYQLPNAWLDGIEYSDGEIVAKNSIGAALIFKQPIQSDCLTISVGPLFAGVLPQLHRTHVARKSVEEARDHCGWNSWEAYGTKVMQADVLENADAIAEYSWLRERIRTIIVDDGWQRALGDWTPNEKFPDGMDGLAEKIRARGFEAGIWTAPFLVSKNSELLKNHPEWFIQDGDAPLTNNGQTYYLDPTHPQARAHIYEIYARLYDWGYRYFKTDFLVEAPMFFVPGRPEYRETARCFDPNLGIMRGMRAAMQTIRAAIGEDSFWLGCGTDIGCGAGLMDASRTGGDIAPFWTRVPHQARSVIHHFHLHGKLFLADPDFLLVKGSDTFHAEYLDIPLVADEPYVVDAWKGGRCFDADDARTWANLVILSGGVLNLSDRIRGLNEVGLSIIQTALELFGGEAAIPLDVENSLPRVLLREEKSHYLLGLFNWDNEESVCVAASAAMGISFPASGVLCDVWSGEKTRVKNGEVAVNLAPHKSRLFKWDKE